MVILSKIPLIKANENNYNTNIRPLTDINYIVIHYTANINDTAYNNARYFSKTVTYSSAHYFVSNSSIYQSVPIQHAAYSVGLGSMSAPYIPNPTHYKKCTNSNSISIELCGGPKGREATQKTKKTAAELTRAIMEELHIPNQNIIRHYDVTGKKCPAWAVKDPMKWLEFQLMIFGGGNDEMEYNEKNYQVFKQFFKRYIEELAAEPATWENSAMVWAKNEGIINDGKPKSYVTRGELATVLQRFEK